MEVYTFMFRDSITKIFMSKDNVFADAFNYLIYDGADVIKPEDLVAQDPTETIVISKAGKVFTDQKYRDVLKLCTIRRSPSATLVLLGIEGQSDVNYAMPVRDYLYDALNYYSQVEKMRKNHRERKDITGREFVSGFAKTDTLTPVITLCICFNKDEWDGPKSLYEMFGELDPKIAKYVDDYKLNLITPDGVSDFGKFSSELGIVLEFIRNSEDKEGMRNMISARQKDLSDIDITAVEMINEFTKANISTENEKGGKINMCQALKELMADERAEGIEVGRAQGKTEGRAEGTENGMDMMVSLLKVIVPGSEDYNLIINGTSTDRKNLLAKYGLTGKS